MNLLFIVPYVPNRIRVRPYQLLRGVARRGHRVTLATLWSSDEERADLDALRTEGIEVIAARLSRSRSAWNCAAGLLTGRPLQADYCWEPELARQIEAALRTLRYDVVYVEHLRGARYGLLARGVARAPVVWDSVDCISHLFEQAAAQSESRQGRLMARFELPRTRRYEAWLLRQFDHALVTSEMDRRALLGLPADGLGAAAPLSVLPNGVDLAYFTPSDEPRETATIVFTGKMSYHANVTAAVYLIGEVMPRVWARRPEARVVIVGKDPTREVRALAEGTERVVVTGEVADMRPYLRRATLAVAPMPYGAGIQNKALEALACGTPLVATSQAVAALQAAPGQEVAVADGAEALAGAIVALLEDAGRRERLGRAGRRYVEREHDWGRVVGRLESVYEELRPTEVGATRIGQRRGAKAQSGTRGEGEREIGSVDARG